MFAQGANLILGKQPYPFFRPGQSLFFDSDFNPEGIATRYERGIVVRQRLRLVARTSGTTTTRPPKTPTPSSLAGRSA